MKKKDLIAHNAEILELLTKTRRVYQEILESVARLILEEPQKAEDWARLLLRDAEPEPTWQDQAAQHADEIGEINYDGGLHP
jgi:uncharacterized membrane-anchored protein YhcB (DUF1043 family)